MWLSSERNSRPRAQLRFRWPLTALLLLMLTLAACGPKGTTTPPEEETPDPDTTGSIEFVIAGLSAGVDGDITVSGPESFTVTESGTRAGLEPGVYTVTASPVAGHNVVGADVQEVEVKVREVADVTVTYTTLPVGSLSITVEGLTAGSLANIEVIGAGYTQSVTETDTLPNLPIGEYSVAVGPVSGHVLSSPSSFTVDIEDGEEATATVTYVAAGLSVSSRTANPVLPLAAEIDLQFDITRTGAFDGEVTYTVAGAEGFLVNSRSGSVSASADTFTITVNDDVADLGTHTLIVNVSGVLHGHTLQQEIDVPFELAAIVTNGGDDLALPEPGTLRALLADDRTDGAVITFAEDLYSPTALTIALEGPLEIDKDVSIAGPTGWDPITGPQVFLKGDQTFAPVIVANDASVTLSNVQVHEGHATDGGGIRVEADSSLVLDGVFVFDNHATSDGGGIWNNGTIRVQGDSQIFQNFAGNYGGGFATMGAGNSAELVDVEVWDNLANVRGGGIYQEWGTLLITGSLVAENESLQNGGGIMVHDVANISGNLVRQHTTVIIENTDIHDNRAKNGAGLYSHGNSLIINSLVAENKAVENGGGIRNHGIMDIAEATIVHENTAGGDYGGVFNDGSMTISDSSITENTAKNGAGIFNGWPSSAQFSNGVHKELLIERTLVAENIASENGGGIHSVRKLTIIDSHLTGNEAGDQGGGIYAVNHAQHPAPVNNGGELNVSGTTIDNNQAGTTGGGIYAGTILPVGMTPDAPFTLLNSTITANTAQSGGGGIYLGANSDGISRLYFNTIARNEASGVGGQGGGMHINRGNVTIHGNLIVQNENTSGMSTRDLFPGAGQVTSGGYNFITTTPPNVTALLSDKFAGPQVVQAVLQLGDLSDANGGPTPTMALSNGSTARREVTVVRCVSTDGTTPLTVDQRGMPRPVSTTTGGARCSIGAYQWQGS